MASVFSCVILVPVAAHDVICKVKYVILYLCLSYFTAWNSWFYKEFNAYNELINQFHFHLLYFPLGSFVLKPLECIVLEKKGIRNPFLVWVIICSLYWASITRTFKFSTKKKSYFTYREAILLYPPVCHCACVRMAVIKIWQYFNLRYLQKFLITEITNKNYSPFL